MRNHEIEREARRDRRGCAIRMISACSAASAFLFAMPQPVSAQTLDRFTADSVVALDVFGGQNVSNRPQMVVDLSTEVRLGRGWQASFRPWFRKARPTTPTGVQPPWDAQLYQAGVRYERPGNIALRVDAGQIVSPIGMGILEWRPNLNPTIVPHLTNVVSMPFFDRTVPRQVPISQAYPIGAVVTVSNQIWDVRGAVVNTAPTHGWAIGADNNPAQTPVFEAGGGITPIVGLRFGGSFAHGKYATTKDAPNASAGRMMTLIGGEAEYAFRYTRLTGEFIRTRFETAAGTADAYEYFVQGVQTLTPRWFGAGRFEGASAPPLIAGSVVGRRYRMGMIEATAGFRVNPAITLRSSYYTRRSYTASAWDQQFGVSVVWSQRWR